MTKRKIAEEQRTTAINICKEEGLSLDDVNTVYNVYKAMSAAIGRVKHNPSYRDRGILFTIGDKAKSATVAVIQSHHFINAKKLTKAHEASGFDENLRIELDRIDNEGHYSLDNINFTTKQAHARKSKEEKCIPVQLLAFGKNGKLHLGGFESKTEAQAKLDIREKRLNKMIEGDYDYTNAAGNSMTFVKLVPCDEPLPEDFKILGENFNKNLEQYLQSLKNYQQYDFCEKREKAIADLSRRLDYYTQREKQS